MDYSPKIIKGRVSGTGWPIDGHTLYFSLWAYDRHGCYHLHTWPKEADEAVMRTLYEAEEAEGMCCCDTLQEFEKLWKSGKYDPGGVFTVALDKVEVLEVVQEERDGAPAEPKDEDGPRKIRPAGADRAVQKMVELIRENPGLPLVSMVETDVVCGDECASWAGAVSEAAVKEYLIAGDRIYFKGDDGMEDVLEVVLGWEEIVGYTSEEMSKAYDGLAWRKAIVVGIAPADWE